MPATAAALCLAPKWDGTTKCLRPAGHTGKCAGCLSSWYNTTPLNLTKD